VLELARLLKAGPRPKRTVYFALFGCEESGGLGAAGFREAPPVPLERLLANVELEMVGLRDPKMPDKLMMTGWERSDLGPILAAAGAKVGPDPYPEGDFFRRSDNYPLALKGVVAHTISAWPTPPTYHQPTDTADSLDFRFMAEAVRSLAGPLRRLADGAATPAWKPGGRP
jgi:aminopeptidase YwaD